MESERLEPMKFTGFLIRRAQQAHVAAWSREVSADTTSVQYGVLAVLSRRPAISQRELCNELDIDRSTIATLVERLERRGWVEREKSVSDKRKNTLLLTPTGAQELARLRPWVDRVEEALTTRLTSEERDELRRLLRLVLNTATTSR